MNKPHPSYSVNECKIKASKLLKALRSDNIDTAKKAAQHFTILPEFADLTSEEIMQRDLKRKHALVVIALQKGFSSWAELKMQLPFIKGGFLNHWFASYA